MPNPGNQVRNQESSRNGLTLEIPTRKGQIQARAQNFLVRGPANFNCLPKELRSLEKSMDGFMDELDKYLETLADRPRCGEASKIHSNDLDCVIKHHKW